MSQPFQDPSVASQEELDELRRLNDQKRLHAKEFLLELQRRTPRLYVTWGVIGICCAVFVVMVARGVDAMRPTTLDLVEWGGNIGLLTIDGQWWRLASCMFLHVGLIHIGFNMWALKNIGPIIERIFGNVPFAILYLLSGIGGSLASLAFHPMTVSAGASGAIFGVIGGLLGVLTVERQHFPTYLFHSLKRFAVSFVGLNIVIGFSIPQIDNAAHLGGLAMGFVCGLILYRPVPRLAGTNVPSQHSYSYATWFRQAAGTLVIALALLFAGKFLGERARQEPLVDLVIYMNHLQPIAQQFDEVSQTTQQLVRELGKENQISTRQKTVEELIRDTQNEMDKAKLLRPRTEKVTTLQQFFLTAIEERLQGLKALQRFIDSKNLEELKGAQGFLNSEKRSNQAIGQFAGLRDELEQQYKQR